MKNKAIEIIAFSLILTLISGMFIFRPNTLHAQQSNPADTVMVKKHSPRKASIMSAVLPGLGQAYNKKYWKIPIIYAGLGAFAYFIASNNSEYQKYKDAYNYVISGDTTWTDNDYAKKYTADQLQQSKDYYKRNKELSMILGCLWYILQIVDASVDAHFFEYDVTDDLSIRIDPMLEPQKQFNFNGTVQGVKLTFKF
ncbi:MAG: DUF5683 domain-containing protein [Bacteroidota bacterium]|nr:DUF5683 domain-containing protein [Bacteroidota bacterium]